MIAVIRRDLMRVVRMTGTAFALISAQAAAAADFQIDNVRLDFGALAMSAPSIAVKGSPLERDAFLAIFSASATEPAIARIRQFTAAEISAPQLVIEQTMGPQKQVTTYRGVRFTDIREGVIARGEAESGAIAVNDAKAGPVRGDIRRTTVEGVDLVQITRMLTEQAQPGANEPMRPLLKRFDQDGYAIDMGPAGKMTAGRASGREVSGRVGAEPLNAVLARIVALSAQTQAQAKVDPKDPAIADANKRLGLSVLTLFDTLDYGSGDIRDIAMAITAPTPDAKPGDRPTPVDVRLARMAYGTETPAKSGFSMEGLQFSGTGGKGSVALVASSGFSIGTAMTELRALLAAPAIDLDAYDYRKLIPMLGTIQLKGLAVEVAPPAPPSTPSWGAPAVAPPVKIGLGNLELSMSEQINGVPSRIALTVDNLIAPIVESPGNPGARDLVAMGYKSVDASARLDLAWEAARNELVIRSLSVGGAGMAKLEASGTLGNVTKDLFASDLALAQVAALGATVRSVEARLQNFGLLEKLVENEARKARRKVEDVRREYAMMANLGLAAILGPSDAAKTLTAAISRFAAKPGTLSVSATAKSSSGLGLADVIAISDPTEIFNKIDLKADAQ